MSGAPKVAHFTIAASMEQSIRWKQTAEAAGHPTVSTWLAEAADNYMHARARSGPPIALAWRRSARFRVVLLDGEEVEVRGMLSPPFGIFKGDISGTGANAYPPYVLVYLPERRILGSFRYAETCKALASELAPTLLRGLPPPDPEAIVERYRREAS